MPDLFGIESGLRLDQIRPPSSDFDNCFSENEWVSDKTEVFVELIGFSMTLTKGDPENGCLCCSESNFVLQFYQI